MWLSDPPAPRGRWAVPLAAACMAALVAGCGGYRWVAEDAAEPGAGAAGPVAVAAFSNETLEPYLGPLLTATVRSRLVTRGVVVDGAAARRLSGRVTDFSDEVLAFDAAGLARHRRVVIGVDVDLREAGAVRWSRRPLVASAEYPVTAGSTQNRDAKDRALEEAAIDLAEQILLDLTALPPLPPEARP